MNGITSQALENVLLLLAELLAHSSLSERDWGFLPDFGLLEFPRSYGVEREAAHFVASASRFPQVQTLAENMSAGSSLVKGLLHSLHVQYLLQQRYAAIALSQFCQIAQFRVMASRLPSILEDLATLVSSPLPLLFSATKNQISKSLP